MRVLPEDVLTVLLVEARRMGAVTGMGMGMVRKGGREDTE